MTGAERSATVNTRRGGDILLPRGQRGSPTRWVIAVMTALAMLGLALALLLAPAARDISGQIAGRATIQIVEGDAIARRELVADVRRVLADSAVVSRVETLPEAELRRMASSWLGEGVNTLGVPLPALIDVDLINATAALGDLRAALAPLGPRVRVVPHAQWLAPIARLMRGLAWTAIGVAAALLIGAGAVAMLAARAALAAQRSTIALLHLVGATDVQIARMFNRQMRGDFWIGALLGAVMAAIALLLIGTQVAEIASPLAAGGGSLLWLALPVALVPVVVALLGLVATRQTILAELKSAP